MTHEEAVTFHMSREVRSYRDLPLILYHFQTKERDEPRPRAGLLRTREFIMKDSYTFDRDEEGLDALLRRCTSSAYDRIFDRAGLEWYRVESDVGMMGGIGAHEYMAPCAAGENEVALSDAGYAANVEIASATPQPVDGLPEPLDAPEPVETPGRHHDRGGVGHARRAGRRADQGLPGDRRGRGPVLVLIRGDHRLNEIKLQNALGAPPARPRRRRCASVFGAVAGFIGPVGARVEVVADEALRGLRGLVAGAQRARHPPARRRARARLRRRAGWTCAPSRPGDTDPSGAHDPHRAGDRGGQHLQARHALLGAARRHLPRRAGRRAADLDGLLRHRPGAHPRRRGGAVRGRGRHLVAALARAVRRGAGRPSARRASRRARWPSGSTRSCGEPASTCSTTTATPRPGEKFADAELLGLPAAPDGRASAAGGRRGGGAGPARALVQSDNIAAYTLAYHVGSQLDAVEAGAKLTQADKFVAQMNALAKQLKMERTRFVNPHGIDYKVKPLPFSTAEDMARLTRYAMNKASFRFYVSQKERQISFNRG